jgi:hypothetical protein
MLERLFNETQYYAAYKAGQQRAPLPALQPRVRLFPRLYRSSYRYTLADIMFAYWEGFKGRPKPKEKVWK